MRVDGAPAEQGFAETSECAQALALFAIDPVGLGGIVLRASAGLLRDAWLARLRALMPPEAPWRRLPLHISDERLLGGLDLSASLQAGRPVAQRGLLAEADGGVVLLAMAERVSLSVAARLAAVLDTRQLVLERDGLGLCSPSRLALVALDEGLEEESLPAKLKDRLAFHLELDGCAMPGDGLVSPAAVLGARARLAAVHLPDALVSALCAVATALGVASMRASLLACRAACAAAAWHGRSEVDEQDAALAARLVLAPRATRCPAPEETSRDESPTTAEPAPPASHEAAQDAAPDEPEADDRSDDGSRSDSDRSDKSRDDSDRDDSDRNDASAPEPAGLPGDIVLAAARAAIPPRLLAALIAGRSDRAKPGGAGRVGALQRSPLRGRPFGVRRGEPRGARLNLMETLRAAAPWQALRRREAAAATPSAVATAPRVRIRRDDFRLTRFRQRSETTTLFVVDASGSAALHRLAETKGAVELLLADCYVRRDSVAVLAFRGRGAELLLPPTRSLVRAKRSLDRLPGGGGTPLAAGIDAALLLCEGLRRKGVTPVVVLLTDGRANIASDGSPGRGKAAEDATAAAARMRIAGFATLVLDTSPQPQEPARNLAEAMGARYLPLPHAGAALLSEAVRAATAG